MTESTSEPVGALATALAHAGRMLAARPDLAQAQAYEILKVVPDSVEARLLLSTALRRQGLYDEALAAVSPLTDGRLAAAPAWLELGLIHAGRGASHEAIRALRRSVQLDARFAPAWRALADELVQAGKPQQAQAAYARQLQCYTDDPTLIAAGAALYDGRLAVAEQALRNVLKARPSDPAAIRMLAEVAARLGRLGDAETLLRRCLEIAPGFAGARENYALVLHRQGKSAQSIGELDQLLASDPHNPGLRGLKAAALGRVGEYQAAIALYEDLLKSYPDQPKAWMSYGHALKTVGRASDSAAAYRRSLALAPGLGEAWWSLANLKTFRFAPDDVDAMQTQLAAQGLGDEDRFHLHFALGKALEDARRDEAAFAHYQQGNALRRQTAGYVAAEISEHVACSKALMTPAFFARRADGGSQAPDPIFVIGLPRSGSTLVEQILASHPQVEGTMELPDVIAMAKRLGGLRQQGAPSAYPDCLAGLNRAALEALGEEYLERTRVQRKTDRPLFIDKMPNNWAHVGLIHLMLPRATIIDVRRHPLGCGFSCFKQHFARGQEFTYDLEEIGRYYADYVELMAHFDRVLPGRVHRVIYEDLIGDSESQVRKLLAHSGLEFDAACLRFYDNDRAVRTASSEQVRRPISAEPAEHWRRFEPWLAPLKLGLGPVLEDWARRV